MSASEVFFKVRAIQIFSLLLHAQTERQTDGRIYGCGLHWNYIIQRWWHQSRYK